MPNLAIDLLINDQLDTRIDFPTLQLRVLVLILKKAIFQLTAVCRYVRVNNGSEL